MREDFINDDTRTQTNTYHIPNTYGRLVDELSAEPTHTLKEYYCISTEHIKYGYNIFIQARKRKPDIYRLRNSIMSSARKIKHDGKDNRLGSLADLIFAIYFLGQFNARMSGQQNSVAQRTLKTNHSIFGLS